MKLADWVTNKVRGLGLQAAPAATAAKLPSGETVGPALHLRPGPDVGPEYRIEGDFDARGGSLHFHGDVVIQGSVVPGSEVAAGGSVTVVGEVARSRILALGNVTVTGGVIQSRLMGGAAGRIRRTLVDMSAGLQAALSRLKSEFQNEEAATNPDRRRMILALLARARNLSTGLDELLEVGLPLQAILPSDLAGAVSGLSALREGVLTTPEDIHLLAETLRATLGNTITTPAERAAVTIRHAHACRLESGGDICVQTTAYRSRMDALGDVMVREQVVGGRVRGFHLDLYEAGTPKGAATVLEIPDGGTITVRTAHAGLAVSAGGRWLTLTQGRQMLRVRARRRGSQTFGGGLASPPSMGKPRLAR